MNLKETLKDYILLEQGIKNCIAQIEELYNIISMSSPILSDMPHGSGNNLNKIPQGIEQLIALKEQLRQDLITYSETRVALHKLIKSIPDLKTMLVVEYKYINGFSCEEIAERFSIGERQVRRIVEKGIEEMKKNTENVLECHYIDVL